MVFDYIYDIFEKIVKDELKGKNVSNEDIHDVVLKEMAKALSVAVYRNGMIENVHAGEGFGTKDFNGIPDSCMKEINIDVCNKCYTMLKLLLSDDRLNVQRAAKVLFLAHSSASDWNEPLLDEKIYLERSLLD